MVMTANHLPAVSAMTEVHGEELQNEFISQFVYPEEMDDERISIPIDTNLDQKLKKFKDLFGSNSRI